MFALESAFSKVASLLPQFWGKGNSRPGAIEHYETLETSFSTETPENTRGGAQRHLEVSNIQNYPAPEHSPPPPHPPQLSPPAQSAVPPARTATVGGEVACAAARSTYLCVGESEALKLLREARCAAYGVELRLSGSTGVYPWVIQCVFGEEGQIPVRVVKGGGMELVMRVRVRGSDGVTFWVRALIDTGSTANLVRGDIGGKLMMPSRSPVRIVQANGDSVKRGS